MPRRATRFLCPNLGSALRTLAPDLFLVFGHVDIKHRFPRNPAQISLQPAPWAGKTSVFLGTAPRDDEDAVVRARKAVSTAWGMRRAPSAREGDDEHAG